MVRSSQELAEEEVRKRTHPIAYALNRVVVSLSNAVLGGTLLSLLIQAFSLNVEFGVRSLATAALPPILIAYLAFFTRAFRSPQPASDFKYYFRRHRIWDDGHGLFELTCEKSLEDH